MLVPIKRRDSDEKSAVFDRSTECAVVGVVRHRLRSRPQPLSSEVTPNATRDWLWNASTRLWMFRSAPDVPRVASSDFS